MSRATEYLDMLLESKHNAMPNTVWEHKGVPIRKAKGGSVEIANTGIFYHTLDGAKDALLRAEKIWVRKGKPDTSFASWLGDNEDILDEHGPMARPGKEVTEGWLFKSPAEKKAAEAEKKLKQQWKDDNSLEATGKSFEQWKTMRRKKKQDKADTTAYYERQRDEADRRRRNEEREEAEQESRKRSQFEYKQKKESDEFWAANPDSDYAREYNKKREGSQSRLDKYGKAGY